MREIVHIQAGQCGNQIGAKVNTMFLYFFTVFFVQSSENARPAFCDAVHQSCLWGKKEAKM